MEYNNWILRKYSRDIVPVFDDFMPFYADFLSNNGVYVFKDLSKSETFIDWGRYPSSFSFWYYFEDCEEEISTRLRKSTIANYKEVIMDFGKSNPVCKIPTKLFVDNWLDFVIGAQYLATVTTPDCNLLIEFTKGDLLRSNFNV